MPYRRQRIAIPTPVGLHAAAPLTVVQVTGGPGPCALRWKETTRNVPSAAWPIRPLYVPRCSLEEAADGVRCSSGAAPPMTVVYTEASKPAIHPAARTCALSKRRRGPLSDVPHTRGFSRSLRARSEPGRGGYGEHVPVTSASPPTTVQDTMPIKEKLLSVLSPVCTRSTALSVISTSTVPEPSGMMLMHPEAPAQ